LPLRVFSPEQAARAFRFMAQARHAGKIVVSQRTATLRVRREGTYLITGGLSGLGLLAARSLASQGAGRLVLLGRRGVTSEAAATLDDLRRSGTEIIAESLDVSSEEGLRNLLERVRANGPPLRGIVHSAGVLDDAGLLQQNAQRFAHVFAPKVQGGWLLDALTRNDPLDWFVSYSSVASVFGSAGQANHSAANAFLDVLAHERRLRGLPSLSINWGPWTEVGAAADRGITERLASQGLGALTPDQGLSAFRRLLESDVTQAAVLPVDWSRYLARFTQGAVPAFFADVSGASSSTQVGKAQERASPQSAGLLQQVTDAPESRRRPLVAAFVRERALRALGVDLGKQVDPRTPLGDLGLDSLLAVELRNTLATALGKPLPATLLFDYPSIDALTDYLLVEVLGFGAAPAQSVPATPPAGLVSSIEAMSDDEVDRLIAARAKRKA
jgi:NAD(P)-dependent dehydrogenase (short-subunit alcohol dehydrogenase family)/acyl carrier protein